MKFILKLFGRILLLFYRIIDRLIVTPISRVIFSIKEYLKSRNIKLDYIFSRPNMMIYISLML